MGDDEMEEPPEGRATYATPEEAVLADWATVRGAEDVRVLWVDYHGDTEAHVYVGSEPNFREENICRLSTTGWWLGSSSGH